MEMIPGAAVTGVNCNPPSAQTAHPYSVTCPTREVHILQTI